MSILHIKKVISLLLLIILSAGLMSSCTGKEVEADNPEQLYETPEYHNLSGTVIKWKQATVSSTNFFGFDETSTFADDVKVRLAWLKEKVGVEFELSTDTYEKVPKNMAAAAATSDVYADAMYMYDEPLKYVLYDSYLSKITDFAEYINIHDTAKWGDYNALETMMWNGDVYAVRPQTWPRSFIDFYAPIIFNQELVASFGIDDPREYYEKGEWDREKFVDMIKLCSDTSADHRIYGLTLFRRFFYQMAILSNNADLVAQKDGEWKNASNDLAFLEALDWARQVLSENADYMNFGADWSGVNTPYIDGYASMIMYPTWGIFGFFDMTIGAWGLMPFPVGPNSEYGNWAAYLDGNSRFFAIPVLSDAPDEIAYVANLLFEPLDSYKTDEAIKQYYLDNYFYDDRDYDLYMGLSKNAAYNYWYEGGNPVVSAMNSGTKTAAEAVQESSEKIQSLIDNYMAANKVGLQKLIDEGNALKNN